MRTRSKASLADVPEQVWLDRGRANALATFHRTARRVPAYRAFLGEHGVRPRDIRTFEDFQGLPTTSKESYLLRYDLVELLPAGSLAGSCVITCSSGYSGEPLFWPRLKRQDDGAVRGMDALYSLFGIASRRTLAVNTFTLGVHVGGQMCTDLSLRVARMPGRKLTFVTPGASIEDILELVKHLSPRFEQTIIWGYPSLVHKVVTRGASAGIDWARLDTFLACAGDGFTESWRRLMVNMIGGRPHPMRVSALFGSADGGLMGFDTPASLLLRQLAHDRPEVKESLFRGQTPLASIQFNPMGRFFESINGELALTCWQAVPMVRYSLRDVGDAIPFSEAASQLQACGICLPDALAGIGVAPEHVWRWPFLSCFGRADGTVSIVGSNIHPYALQHVFASHPEVSHFKLTVEDDAEGGSRLAVYVEVRHGALRSDARARLERRLHDEVLEALLKANPDYVAAYRDDRQAADPLIHVVGRGRGPFAEDAGRWKRSHLHRERAR